MLMRIVNLWHRPDSSKETVVRVSGASPPLSIYKKLMEVPLAALGRRHVSNPEVARSLSPPSDDTSAANHWLLPRICSIRDGRVF
jgi:hypothetical protein